MGFLDVGTTPSFSECHVAWAPNVFQYDGPQAAPGLLRAWTSLPGNCAQRLPEHLSGKSLTNKPKGAAAGPQAYNLGVAGLSWA